VGQIKPPNWASSEYRNHRYARASEGRAMTSYEIIVYAPSAPPRSVHMGTSEADMHSHLNAVEGTLQAMCATARLEISRGGCSC
jgi:hypothetical protein